HRPIVARAEVDAQPEGAQCRDRLARVGTQGVAQAQARDPAAFIAEEHRAVAGLDPCEGRGVAMELAHEARAPEPYAAAVDERLETRSRHARVRLRRRIAAWPCRFDERRIERMRGPPGG